MVRMVLGIDAVFDKTLNTIAPFFAGFLLNYFTAQNILLIFVSFFWLSLFCSFFVYKINILSKVSNS